MKDETTTQRARGMCSNVVADGIGVAMNDASLPSVGEGKPSYFADDLRKFGSHRFPV
jgi:hypothetical protein